MSKLNYGLVFSLNALPGMRSRLQVAQNRALRICGLTERGISNIELHRRFGVLPVALRCKLDLMILMFKKIRRIRGNLANFDTEIAATRPRTSSHAGPVLPIPRPYSSIFRRSVSYMGPSEWLQLPSEIRSITDLGLFKNQVRRIVDTEFLGLTRI